MAEAAQSTNNSTLGERMSVCHGRYDLLTGMPLVDLELPSATAFSASAGRGGGSFIAYVLKPREIARQDFFGQAVNVTSTNALKFLDADVVFWPEYNHAVPVIIYEKPAGPRFFSSLEDERQPLLSEITFRNMVVSLSDGLRDIYLAGCNHGRINPTNLFVRDSNGGLQFGDYLSSLAGLHQHPAFETIERMMCHPAGKGSAAASDDIYAIGVTLMTVLLGKLPAFKLSSDELLKAKLEKGSLMALLCGMRLPGAYSELMRGLLADDVKQRWNLDDIGHWLGGRRLGSKAANQIRKAQRSFELDGMHYNNYRLLAHALTKNPDNNARVVEDASLDRWIHRSIGDEDMALRVTEAAAAASAATRGGNLQERLITRIAMAMDPLAPIRLREVAALPYGLGQMLAYNLIHQRNPKSIADIIGAQLISYWVSLQSEFSGESSSLMQSYDAQRMLMDRNQYGFGIERVAYEMNEGLPCLSPLVAKYNPLNLKALMIALEQVASESGGDDRKDLIDRHIAAFILNRHRRINDRYFTLLSSKETSQRAIAILNIYAEVQRKFYPEPLPALAEWITRLLTPSVETFHNRALRERILRDIQKVGKKGMLDQVLALIDDSNIQKNDNDGFESARKEYTYWEKQARELGGGNQNRGKTIYTQARTITAFVSCFIAMAAIIICVFLQVM